MLSTLLLLATLPIILPVPPTLHLTHLLIFALNHLQILEELLIFLRIQLLILFIGLEEWIVNQRYLKRILRAVASVRASIIALKWHFMNRWTQKRVLLMLIQEGSLRLQSHLIPVLGKWR